MRKFSAVLGTTSECQLEPERGEVIAVPGGERSGRCKPNGEREIVYQLQIRKRKEDRDRVRSRMQPQSAVRTIEELKLDAAYRRPVDTDIELDTEETSAQHRRGG